MMPLYNSDCSSKPINNCVNGEAKHTNAIVSAFDHAKHSATALVGRPLTLQKYITFKHTTDKNTMNIGRSPV